MNNGLVDTLEWDVVAALLPGKPKVRKELANALRQAVRSEVIEMANILQAIVRKDIGEHLKYVNDERKLLDANTLAMTELQNFLIRSTTNAGNTSVQLGTTTDAPKQIESPKAEGV